MSDDDGFEAFSEEREVPAYLQPLLERLRASAKTETVFGPSREEGGRTIVPVAKVSYGAGGGSGSSAKKRKGAGASPDAEQGAGVGGGINVSPLGVFEVGDGGLRFVPVEPSRFMALAALAGGVLLGLVVGRAGKPKR
jgi:uncharacterized spore protein YtfJ